MACITINTKDINFVTVFNPSLDNFNTIKILKLIIFWSVMLMMYTFVVVMILYIFYLLLWIHDDI